MPRPAAVDTLPEAVRAELDRELARRAFSGYAELAEWLEAQGYAISRSALHRYGQKVQRRLEAIRASTEAARLIADAAPDREDSRSAAVIALVQSELFEAMLSLQQLEGDDDPARRVKLLSNAARAIAEASRASVAQKKWAEQVRREALAEAAEAVEKKAGAQGLSAEAVAAIKAEILGLGDG